MTTVNQQAATLAAAPDDRPARRDRLRLVLVLGALIAIGPLTIDMYLPALPTIMAGLDTTSAALLGAVQFVVGALAAPLVGILGNGSVGMALVVVGGMLSAVAVLYLVVRPGRPGALDSLDEDVIAVAGVH